MPNIQSAKKKLRQDKKRSQKNAKYELAVKKAIKTASKAKEKKQKTLDNVFSLIDTAAKHKVIHKNKAARLKARVSKLFARAK
jgi:small subunit ribosomal protein S20